MADASSSTGKCLPLKGLRVIDTSYMFAGPYAGALLSDLGADVIKIEGPARMDFTRNGLFSGLLPDNQQGDDPWNRTSCYNLLNRGKRSLVVDLSKPEGREIFVDLIKTSDVLIENFTPRVMRRWKLDFPNLQKINPNIVLVSNTGYGHTGPYSSYPAQASSMEATHGLAAVTGYRGGPPMKAGQSYIDFVAASACVLGTMLGLRYRKRFGRGLWVDIGMYQLGCFNVGEYILDWAANGVQGERVGSRHRSFAPQGVYSCAGGDAWVAVSVRDDEDWQALCGVIGRSDLAQAYPDVSARRAAHDEIDFAIGEWTRNWSKMDAMHELQAAGVPAGAVLDGRDLHLDPHLKARGLLEEIEYPPHRGIGTKRKVVGRPWRFDRIDAHVKGPAPAFAEHNREILKTDLGYDDERINALEQSGIVPGPPKRMKRGTELTLDERVRLGRLAYWDPDYRERLGYPNPGGSEEA